MKKNQTITTLEHDCSGIGCSCVQAMLPGDDYNLYCSEFKLYAFHFAAHINSQVGKTVIQLKEPALEIAS